MSFVKVNENFLQEDGSWMQKFPIHEVKVIIIFFQPDFRKIESENWNLKTKNNRYWYSKSNKVANKGLLQKVLKNVFYKTQVDLLKPSLSSEPSVEKGVWRNSIVIQLKKEILRVWAFWNNSSVRRWMRVWHLENDSGFNFHFQSS